MATTFGKCSKTTFGTGFLALMLNLVFIQRASGFLSQNIFDTKDSRLFDTFCVNSTEELEMLSISTFTHDKIIIGGLRKSVISYFKDIEPSTDIDINTEDSLSRVFQTFYGACASPLKFQKAVKDIIDSSSSLDTIPIIKDDPRYSFDSEYILETQSRLLDLYSQIISAVTSQQKYQTARKLLGQSLRIIQRFYSHSNWLELENVDILEGLGVPGSDLGDIADATEETCSGSNVVSQKLTSGYHSSNTVDGENITIPMEVEKCRHGGTGDKSSVTSGINKDTPNSCFSPGANLHDYAAKMASDATFHYVEFLREIIGNGNFSQMLDLSAGSAFVVSIDTTGSMSGSINAVKHQVAEIIAAAEADGVKPSTYILVPFNDPLVGPAVRTEDTDYFLSAVNSLNADGGGDSPEMFWGGLQLALTTAPPYSDIICFTDALGKDGHLMPSVFALAKERFARVSIITSLISKDVSTIADYIRICQETGGLMIPSNNVDVDEIAGILAKSIESSKASIAIISNLKGASEPTFAIDDFWSRSNESVVEVKIAGGVVSAELVCTVDGRVVNLMDGDSIASSEWNIEVIVKQDGLLYFSFKPDASGNWQLRLNNGGASATYSVNVDATCTFDFLSDFRFLDIYQAHPAFQLFQGQPIVGSLPVVAIGMVGLEVEVLSAIHGISLIDALTNKEVRFYPKPGSEVAEEFVIETYSETENRTGLPMDPFYIQLKGQDAGGNNFTRTLTTPIAPASTQVEVTASSAKLEATPGSTVESEFTITNYGVTATIDLNVIDTESYLVEFGPKSVVLAQDQMTTLTAKFGVPASAQVGSESQITVGAHSQLDLTDNYVNVQLKVISGQVDQTVPKCRLTQDPVEDNVCAEASETNCMDTTWHAEGSAWDAESGLQTLRLDGDQDTSFSSDSFATGFMGNVSFQAEGACCSRTSKVVAIDQKGNAGFCKIDFGGFSCSGQYYCQIFSGNLLTLKSDVESEQDCRKHCLDEVGCTYYSWFSESHDFPLLPTPALTCLLLSDCDSQVFCSVCRSGPTKC